MQHPDAIAGYRQNSLDSTPPQTPKLEPGTHTTWETPEVNLPKDEEQPPLKFTPPDGGKHYALSR